MSQVLEDNKSNFEKDLIEKYLNKYHKLKEKGVSEEEINALSQSPYCSSDNLKLKVAPVDEILINDEASSNLLLDSKYAIQFLGAGAASRLGKGPMFTLNLLDLLSDDERKKNSNLNNLTLGQRHLIQYRLTLENLALKAGRSAKDIIDNQSIIIHLNQDSAKECIQDVVSHNFYGFNRKNIYFVVQETYNSYSANESGEIVKNFTSKKYPFGHGQTLIQLNYPNTAFRILESGDLEFLSISLIDHLLKKGVEILGTHRINDLTKLTKNSICQNRINYAKTQFENGSNVAVELVANPHNQKGGKWLSWESHDEFKHNFLIETLNAKSPIWKKAFNELEENHFKETKQGIPYNAFRLMYNLNNLKYILNDDLIPSLRERDNGYTLELTTGDVTQNPKSKSVGFQVSGELIKDFKSLSDLPRALEYIKYQESQENFQKLVNEILGI